MKLFLFSTVLLGLMNTHNLSFADEPLLNPQAQATSTTLDQRTVAQWVELRQELDGLLDQLSSQRSWRTGGTVIGVTASSALFLGGMFTALGELFASVVVSGASTVMGGPLAHLASSTPDILLAGSCVGLLGTVSWFVIQQSKVGTLKRMIKNVRDQVQRYENAFRGISVEPK